MLEDESGRVTIEGMCINDIFVICMLCIACSVSLISPTLLLIFSFFPSFHFLVLFYFYKLGKALPASHAVSGVIVAVKGRVESGIFQISDVITYDAGMWCGR